MLKAIIILVGLGAVLSAILVSAYTKLAIALDEKQKSILDALPGANCGACGLAGCEAYAEALAKGETEVGLCTVGGKEVSDKIADILGIEAKEVEEKIAVVKCQGDCEKSTTRFDYIGLQSCEAATLVGNGPKACEYGCLGFGDCVEVCQFDAIKMGENRIPLINEKECKGCGKCVDACPREVLELIPKAQKVYVACNSKDPTKVVKEYCEIGCIACKLCEKSCPYNAIKVEENLAILDFSLCQNCGVCVTKCQLNVIVDRTPSRPKAMIGGSCTGCGECVPVCPFKAISGEKDEQYKVDLKKCIGCSLCYKTCKEGAITMAFALGYKESNVKL